MIARLKRFFIFVCLVLIFAFVFSDGLLYYCSRWHEKTGEVKKALEGYKELVKKHPGGRWTERAKEAIERLKEKQQ